MSEEMSDEELEALIEQTRKDFSSYVKPTVENRNLKMHRSLSEQVTHTHKSGLEKTRYRNQ